MKVIIAGSRSITGYPVIEAAINAAQIRGKITEVVSGTARGVDLAGENWARSNKIPIKRFKPDWNQGSKAGPLRNIEMGKYADAAVVIWDGVSTGSKHMFEYMRQLSKPRFMYRVQLEIDDNATVWFNLPDGRRLRGY